MKSLKLSSAVPATLLFVPLAALLILGCGGKKKPEPVPVGELAEYRDPAYGFHVSYPKDWTQDAEVGVRARFFNAPEVDKRFLDPTGAYPDGVGIFVEITKTERPDSARQAQITEMGKMGFMLEKEFPVQIGGKDGVRVNYTGNYTAQIKESGHHIYVTVDTLLYDLRCAGFGDLYEAYKGVFDAALAKFEFPKPVEKGRDPTLPAESMTEYSTQYFSFQYPENFNFTNPPKGSNDLVLELRGQHLSTSIRFDVFGAKGLTTQKVFDQNRPKFPASASVGKARIGGQEAATLTYSPTGLVERRLYFTVKNDKVIRLTLDWVKVQRADYLAAYDKVVNSIKLR